jgi:hypothetical protein
MSTPCKHETAPAGARFCPLCGERMTAPAAKPQAVHVQIDQNAEQVGQGGMIGMSVGEIQGNVHVVHNNVFHINNPSPEAIERLAMLGAISTEVRPANPNEAVLPAQKLSALEGQTGEILKQVRKAEQQRGVRVEHVELGGVQVSRVELLVKRAILLKAEADQMMLDHVATHRAVAGFDSSAHERKLREALDLLREAQNIDPTNAEVLLHQAQLLGLLETVDDKEVRRLLYQVQQLLTPPRNDTDKFHLAQATFLTAVSGDQTHEGQLRDARNMFAEIGRSEWVSHCDQMLEGLTWHAGFQPAGNWRLQISDGSTTSLQLGSDGSMLGARDPYGMGPYEMGVSFSGQWAFDPHNQILQLQGMTEAFTPIFLQIQMQGKQGNVFAGFGSDGYQYHFTRY